MLASEVVEVKADWVDMAFRLPQEDEGMSDIMLLGVLEMPPSMWDGDSLDIAQRHSRYKQAAQRIRDDEALIDAKDAEIAELRARLSASEASDAESIAMFRKARDERDEALREVAGLRAELAEWNTLGTAVIYGGVPARDTPTLWPNPWRQNIAMVAWAYNDIAGQRDEARECVRRLWPLVNEHADCLRAEADAALLERKRKGFLSELANVESALAATPEHLRK